MTLKELRENLGYSQSAVESITGVSQSTISRIELTENKNARTALTEWAIMEKLRAYEAQRNVKK